MTPRKRARQGARTLIVDRWVDRDTARAELDGKVVELPRSLLPSDAMPDAAMRVERAADQVTITLDPGATGAAARESERLSAKLRRRDGGGDVTL